MDISVIMTTFRRPDLLRQTLASFCELETRELEWELVLVDNAGDEEVREVAERFTGKLPLRFLVEPRRGQNHARNCALAEARGELYVFTDDDVIVEKRWLLEAWDGAGRWPEDRMFGGRILPKWPSGGARWVDHPALRGAYAIADWGRREGPYEASRVWSPNMAIRASVFRQGFHFSVDVGPDGTDNYLMGSETELMTRLEQVGLRAIYLPRAVVRHQIRPEQLAVRWLYGRAFRVGRAAAQEAGISHPGWLARALRWLGRGIGQGYLRVAYTHSGTDGDWKIVQGLAYWYVSGLVYQCLLERRVPSARISARPLRGGVPRWWRDARTPEVVRCRELLASLLERYDRAGGVDVSTREKIELLASAKVGARLSDLGFLHRENGEMSAARRAYARSMAISPRLRTAAAFFKTFAPAWLVSWYRRKRLLPWH